MSDNILKTTKVTIFKDLKDILNPYVVTLETALTRIKNGDSKTPVTKMRDCLKKNDVKGYDAVKRHLPAVVYGGESTQRVKMISKKTKKEYYTCRAKESVIEHSGVFVLDFDKVKDVSMLMNRLKQDNYILAAWLSPSGDDNPIKKGVKGLVRCPKNIEEHELYYNAFIEHRYPELDSSQKNIDTLCFESYDPNIYINHNAKVWDKKINKKEQEKIRKTRKGGNETKIINRILPMFLQAGDGEKHHALCRAAYTLGGYVGSGAIDEERAKESLKNAVDSRANEIKDIDQAYDTIDTRIEEGQKQPLEEIKKKEKEIQATRNPDGSLICFASQKEMDEYIQDFINGTLEMGLSTGFGKLDEHFLFKKKTLVFAGGVDNIGKSLVLWYLAVLGALFHGWKFVIYSAENSDGQVKKKIQELYLNTPAKQWSKTQRDKADEFFNNHFRVMTCMKSYSWDKLLFWAEVIYDSDFMFDSMIIDPYNAMWQPGASSMHERTIEVMNKLQEFKKNYASLWIADHANSSAARNKDEDGYVKVPWKADLDGGQIKANKVDDFLMFHRIVNSPENYRDVQIHVNKIKDTETGGSHTMKDSPVVLTANKDLCGFHDWGGYDPVEDYWRRNNVGEQSTFANNNGNLQPNTEDFSTFAQTEEGDAPF